MKWQRLAVQASLLQKVRGYGGEVYYGNNTNKGLPRSCFYTGHWDDPLRGRQQQGVADSPKGQYLLWETPWDGPVGDAAQQSSFMHLRLNVQISCPASARKVSAPAAETGHFPCAVRKHMKDMNPGGLPACPHPAYPLCPLGGWWRQHKSALTVKCI